MSNGAQCCALEICCPAGPTARAALITEIMHGTSCTVAEASVFAEWLQHNFDLAPRGTLQPLKEAIVRLVREAQET